MNFEQRIFQFIKDNRLIHPGGLVMAGFSGGADSMALMQALVALRHDLAIQLHAVHFNHKMRPQAQDDERFVVQWCQRLNVPVTVGRRQGVKTTSLSEDGARQMRFKFFIKHALRLKAHSVALAHTRNDLAETVLMRLMRGSGFYGLRGILPHRSIEGVNFVRPLLGIGRADVEEYLKLKKVPYCTDLTNQQTKYTRNKVRLELLPLLAREYNPQIIGCLSDLGKTAGDDYEFLSSHAHRIFKKDVIISSERVKITIKQMRLLHPAMRRLIIRLMAEALTRDPAVLNFEHICAVEDLITHKSCSAVHLPHRLMMSKTKKFIELSYA
ncbi:MAG: tRNA lysidine(34) synthetase TilS [Candidatus Omnitrophica bacterium]|nr:tRNA lysidine(34) synthetase TilS [Candidatus Omnitrophota bacterium]